MLRGCISVVPKPRLPAKFAGWKRSDRQLNLTVHHSGKGQQTIFSWHTYNRSISKVWFQCSGLNKSLTTLIIGHTVRSKVTEIKACFEHLFTPCLLSVSLVLNLVNTTLGSPAFKVVWKIGNKYSAWSHIEDSHVFAINYYHIQPATEYINFISVSYTHLTLPTKLEV